MVRVFMLGGARVGSHAGSHVLVIGDEVPVGRGTKEKTNLCFRPQILSPGLISGLEKGLISFGAAVGMLF